MPSLTKDEINRLLETPTIARLATITPTGTPYIVPIWQQWDGEHAYVIPRGKARFVEHIRLNSHVALSIADDINPSHDRVLIEGHATIEAGPVVMSGRMLAMATEMASRYGGEEGLTYLKGTLEFSRYLVCIRPQTITSWRGTWHARYR
ncbi:MAG: pyridoxamine 5'-phosphate oxidase family protein [Pseudomonadota bacterium]